MGPRDVRAYFLEDLSDPELWGRLNDLALEDFLASEGSLRGPRGAFCAGWLAAAAVFWDEGELVGPEGAAPGSLSPAGSAA